jgi:hypothetical protein
MRPLVLLAHTVLILVAFTRLEAKEARLAGCPDPIAVAAGLARLQQSGWQEVSVDRLRAIWPTPLEGLDCTADTCSSLWTKGRIIDGHCECCETFFFDARHGDDGIGGEHLNNIVINFSAGRREDVVSTAKTLAAASGLPAGDVASIGREALQNFHWYSTRQQRREMLGVEIHIVRRASLWELYFNVGHFLP